MGPVTLRLQPIVETFLVDRESGEEFTAEQLDRPLEVLYIGRVRRCLELERIHGPSAGVQPDDLLVSEESVRRTQILTQQGQCLPQALPGLLIGAASPQQRRQLRAGRRLLPAHHQKRRERAHLLG